MLLWKFLIVLFLILEGLCARARQGHRRRNRKRLSSRTDLSDPFSTHQIIGLDKNHISYATSPSNPDVQLQIILRHRKTGSLLVINPKQQQYGFLQKDRRGVVVDEKNDDAYTNYNYDFRDEAPPEDAPEEVSTVNLTEVVQKQAPEDVDNMLEKNSIFGPLADVLYDFGFDSVKTSSDALSSIFSRLREKICSLMDFLRGGLSSFVETNTRGWVDMQSNLWEFLNKFSWVKKFVSSLSGKSDLKEDGVQFELEPVLRAGNGIEAFNELLKPIAEKGDISASIQDITNTLARAAEFITGLGGGGTQGMTGIFKIVSNIINLLNMVTQHPLEFINREITPAINYISNLIMGLFSNSPKTTEDWSESASRTFDLFNQQDQQYHNMEGLENIMGLLKASCLNGTFSIFGIDIAPIFDMLANGPFKSVFELLVSVFNHIKSVLPLDVSFPNLVLSMVHKLLSFTGLVDLETALPNLDVTALEEEEESTFRSLPINETEDVKTEDIKTSQLIRKFPAAKQIADQYELAAESYAGQKVHDALDDSHYANDKLREALLIYNDYL